jgi:Flp pilus assembly pilin Flp
MESDVTETIPISNLRARARRSRRSRRPRPHFRPSVRRRSRRWGATAIEYCFMLSLVLMVIILAVQYFGGSLTESFKHSDNKMQQIGL